MTYHPLTDKLVEGFVHTGSNALWKDNLDNTIRSYLSEKSERICTEYAGKLDMKLTDFVDEVLDIQKEPKSLEDKFSDHPNGVVKGCSVELAQIAKVHYEEE